MRTLRETVRPLLKLFKGLKTEKIKIIYLLDLGIRKIHAKSCQLLKAFGWNRWTSGTQTNAERSTTPCQMFELKLKKRFLRIHLADVLSDVDL